MSTKGSFTRDEWDHLLRLLNIKNSRCFLAAIFFQAGSSVSCRRELRKVHQRRFGSGETETNESGVKEPLRKIRVIQTALESTLGSELCFIQNNQNPTMYFQEWQQDDAQSSSTKKLERRDEPSSSSPRQETGAR